MRYKLIAAIASLCIAADQYTKYLITTMLSFADAITVTSYLNIVHVRNRGAAFGFLNNPDMNWQIYFFLGTTCVALGVIVYLAKKAAANEYALLSALGLISGGAIGNAIDRIFRKSVVDFLDLHYYGWHWPAFNVADIVICAGAIIILLFIFIHPQPCDAGKKKSKGTSSC